MILSGGIFSFDKLNNAISTEGKAPLIADVWASRWAYEAICVEQFKSNGYQKLFYDIERQESEANYVVSFWSPKIDEIATIAVDLAEENTDSTKLLLRESLTLLSSELKRQRFKPEGFGDLLADLNESSYNEAVLDKVKAYLSEIKTFYSRLQGSMVDKRDSVIFVFEENYRGKLTINQLKDRYHNESLSDFVRNENVLDKTTIYKGRIIQHTDPVFKAPNDVSNVLDYRAHFFAPEKHFFGKFFGTYWFNMAVIWLMTVLLYVTLYYESIRKGVAMINKLVTRQ
jgi:hypothetical protein